MQNSYKVKWKVSFTAKNEIGVDSRRLGTYFSFNPDLQRITEKERKITTRFRTGSHSLR